MNDSYRHVTYELLDEGRIARVMLNRPKTRNAQSRGLLLDLHDALMQAEADDGVRVVIVGGHGSAFSSGHDLGSAEDVAERTPPTRLASYEHNGGSRKGVEGATLQEWHYFFQNTLRWRNLRKITIAQVHGPVFAAGLMLMWSCDLIAASDDAVFAEVVGTRLGMCGTEYFAHPWELGPRRAKELLLTGDAIGAHEAYRIGMVNKVFPRGDLEDRTLQFAGRIASLPSVTSLLIKESVNQSVDAMGFSAALNACFSIHQLNAAHWSALHGDRVAALPEDGIPVLSDAPPVKLRQADSV
jgi:enoyl-CoA hydratase